MDQVTDIESDVVEIDLEYLEASLRLHRIRRKYYVIAYHNIKWLGENPFTT